MFKTADNELKEIRNSMSSRGRSMEKLKDLRDNEIEFKDYYIDNNNKFYDLNEQDDYSLEADTKNERTSPHIISNQKDHPAFKTNEKNSKYDLSRFARESDYNSLASQGQEQFKELEERHLGLQKQYEEMVDKCNNLQKTISETCKELVGERQNTDGYHKKNNFTNKGNF